MPERSAAFSVRWFSLYRRQILMSAIVSVGCDVINFINDLEYFILFRVVLNGIGSCESGDRYGARCVCLDQEDSLRDRKTLCLELFWSKQSSIHRRLQDIVRTCHVTNDDSNREFQIYFILELLQVTKIRTTFRKNKKLNNNYRKADYYQHAESGLDGRAISNTIKSISEFKIFALQMSILVFKRRLLEYQ